MAQMLSRLGGARTVVDTDSHLSIGNHVLMVEEKTPTAWGNPGIWWPATARERGKWMMSVVTVNDISGVDTGLMIGFNTALSSFPSEGAHFFYSDGFIYLNPGNVKTQAYNATSYILLTVLDTTGAYHFAKGGAMTAWTYNGKSPTGSTATLYPNVSNLESSSYVRMVAMGDAASLPVTVDYIAANLGSGNYASFDNLFLYTGSYPVCFDGDSLTIGVLVNRQQTYPYQLMTALGSSIRWFDVSVGGSTSAQMAARASALVDTVPGCRVVVVWAGTNDLSTLTAAQSYANMRAYCEARRAAGFKVIVLTLLPRTDSGLETKRSDFNTLVRDNWEDFADGLADIGADTTIGEAGDQLNTTYYQADELHLKAAGYAIVAGIVEPVLAALL